MKNLILSTSCLLALLAGPLAPAAVTISSAVGGAPTGVNYLNFNDLNLGNAGGATSGPSGSATVSFTGTGQVVTGSAGGLYAAPFLSNSNGVVFGDATVSGADATKYLSTGIGSVTLNFSAPLKYVGLLWGSVDNYNTLKLFDGATEVGSITGSDVTALPNGDQGANGTYYVNINSDLNFDRVVASSTNYAFEFDNVAYNKQPQNVPEGGSACALLGLGLVGLAATRHHLKKAKA